MCANVCVCEEREHISSSNDPVTASCVVFGPRNLFALNCVLTRVVLPARIKARVCVLHDLLSKHARARLHR